MARATPRSTAARGGITGRRGSTPAPATGSPRRSSSAARRTRHSNRPPAATCTSLEGRTGDASSRSSGSTGTSSGSRSGARAPRCCSSWGSAATSRCGIRSSGRSTLAASRPSRTTPRGPASRRRAVVPLRMPGLARQAAHLLDALGHPHADVLGVSFGGAVAQELTLAHQHRLRRLVLVSTMCGLGGVPGNPLALSLLATPLRYYSPAFMRLTADRPVRAAGERRRELLRAADRGAPGPSADAVGLRRTARRRRRLVEPSVAAPHPHPDTRADRRSRRHRARRSTPASSPAASPTRELEIVPDAGHLLAHGPRRALRHPHRRFLASDRRVLSPPHKRTRTNLVVRSPKPSNAAFHTVAPMEHTDTATRIGHFASLPDRRAAVDPDGACLDDDRVTLTNIEFLERVRAAAALFAARGVGPGDVVATLLTNRAELVVTMFAAWRLGAALTPVNPSLTAGEAAFQIQDAGARVVVHEGDGIDLGEVVGHRRGHAATSGRRPDAATAVTRIRPRSRCSSTRAARPARRRGSCSTTPTSSRWST